MTSKILTGTYSAGYTLSAGFTDLTITSAAVVSGVTATSLGYAGGVGVLVTFLAPVSNAGKLTGGDGAAGYPSGGKTLGGSGGGGGAGADLTAGGSFANAGAITGGTGGGGGEAYGGGRGGGGGDGVELGAAGSVSNTATIHGGAGGSGAVGHFSGSGGAGGAGVDVAGGSVANSGAIYGGDGGRGANGANPGAGGDGGAGILLRAVGTVSNTGRVFAGASGQPGIYYSFEGNFYGAYGYGGTGIALALGGSVFNSGTIAGGGGYPNATGAGAGVFLGGAGTVTNMGAIFGGPAGAAVLFGVAAELVNRGSITGGQSFYGGFGGAGVELLIGGTVANSGHIVGGAEVGASKAGHGGVGVSLVAGGVLANTGTIKGGIGHSNFYDLNYGGDGVDVTAGGRVTNGASGSATAEIYGHIGVTAGAGSAATIVNFGTISGYAIYVDPVAIQFASAADRLIAEAGSTVIGAVIGGGGALELAGGIGTITGLGATGTLSGAEAMTFSGFGTYQIDASATWTLSGANTLAASHKLIDDGHLNLAAGASLTIGNGGLLEIKGAVANAGSIALSGTTSFTDLLALSPGVTLSGGGTINLAGPKAEIHGQTATTLLTNVDNTITGTGFIGAGKLKLVNELHGLIETTTAGSLIVDTKGSVLTNGGQMFAIGSSSLLLIESTTVDQTAGGVIASGTGCSVRLQDDVIDGGFLVGTGRIDINVAGGELNGVSSPVTLQGLVRVLNGANELLVGSIVNTGKMDLVGGAKVTDLIVGAAGANLSGKGTVILAASANNRIYGQAPGDTLTNVDNLIEGAGQLGNGVMKLVNQAGGEILGNQSVGLTINTAGARITNAGLIENSGSGGTLVKSAMANTGLLYAFAGTLTLDGAVTGAGAARIRTGTLDIAAGFGETVTFVTGATGTLELTDFKDFTGHVQGLSLTGANAIDLAGFTLTGAKATYSGTTAAGVLTVTNGAQTAKISLTGNYTGATFTVTTDGHGGVLVKDPPAGGAAALVTAMASFQSQAPPHLAEAPTYRLPRLPMLHERA